MKFIGPQWQAQASSGGGGSAVDFKIKYSNNRPNDLENGLWIKNDKQLPLLEVSDWNRMEFPNNHIIEEVNKTIYSNYESNIRSAMSSEIKHFFNNKQQILYTSSGGSTIYYYDYTTNTYTYTPTGINAITQISGSSITSYTNAGLTTCLCKNKDVYVWGGYGYKYTGSSDPSPNSVVVNNTLYIYNYATNTITTKYKPSTNFCRGKCVDFTYNNQDYIFIFGITTQGFNYYRYPELTTSLGYCYVYNIQTNTYTSKTYTGATDCSYYKVIDDVVYIYGGTTYNTYGSGQAGQGSCQYTNLIQRFDLNTLSFLSSIAMNSDHLLYNGNTIYRNMFDDNSFINIDGINYSFNLNTDYPTNETIYSVDTFNCTIQEETTYQDFFKYIIYTQQDGFYITNTYRTRMSTKWVYKLDDNHYMISSISGNGYIFTVGDKRNYVYSESEPKCYPVLYTGNNGTKLQLNRYSLKNTESEVTLLKNIHVNPNSSTYNKAYQLYKVYKPDYSGEEQEAWLVSGGVWTLVGGSEVTEFKGRCLNIDVRPSNGILGTEECIWVTYNNNNNPPYTQKYTNGNTTYLYMSRYGSNGYNQILYIRADLIAGFDDSISFGTDYVNELFKRVKIVAPSLNYIASTSTSTSQYMPFVSASAFSNVKYLSIIFTTYTYTQGYDSDNKLIAIEVYV